MRISDENGYVIPRKLDKITTATRVCTVSSILKSKMYTLNTKIINRIENKLPEFKFKLTHNSPICGQILSKWTNISPNCVSCQKRNDIPHMVYHCTVCKKVWDKN